MRFDCITKEIIAKRDGKLLFAQAARGQGAESIARMIRAQTFHSRAFKGTVSELYRVFRERELRNKNFFINFSQDFSRHL